MILWEQARLVSTISARHFWNLFECTSLCKLSFYMQLYARHINLVGYSPPTSCSGFRYVTTYSINAITPHIRQGTSADSTCALREACGYFMVIILFLFADSLPTKSCNDYGQLRRYNYGLQVFLFGFFHVQYTCMLSFGQKCPSVKVKKTHTRVHSQSWLGRSWFCVDDSFYCFINVKLSTPLEVRDVFSAYQCLWTYGVFSLLR